MPDPIKRNSLAIQYFVICICLWFIVDFGTAGGFKLSYFEKYGLTLAFFYIGYPLVFTFLLFKLHYTDRKIFVATIIAIFIIEVLLTKNPLVMHWPWILFGIPLAIAVYVPLTYFPLWMVHREMKNHLRIVIPLVVVDMTVIFLTTFGNKN